MYIILSRGDDGEKSRQVRSQPQTSLLEMAKQQWEHRKVRLPARVPCVLPSVHLIYW